MFQKKPIYIIGIVLFTLILIADLVLYLWIPTGFGRGDLGGFGSGMPGGFGAENSGFDSLEGSDTQNGGSSGFEGFGGGSFQDKGSFDAMRPDGENGDFTFPEGMEMPENMSPPEGMGLQEDFAPFLKPNGGQMGSAMAIFSTMRNLFWPVLVVCVVGDGLCIFMLIRINRKKKAAALPALAASDSPEQTAAEE